MSQWTAGSTRRIYASYDPLKDDSPGEGAAYPKSYWAATLTERPPRASRLEGVVHTEVAIIGAGYTGLSCAYHLSKSGFCEPVVLEANRAGWGCSGRNGGFARPALGRLAPKVLIRRSGLQAAQALFWESVQAVDVLQEIIKEGRIECDRQAEGIIKVAHAPRHVEALKREQSVLKSFFHYETEMLDAQALKDKYLCSAEAYAGLWAPNAFCVHPLKLALGLQQMAVTEGAKIYEASPVVEWRKEGEVHNLSTPQGIVKARYVVIATNGYTSERLHPAITRKLLPVLSNIIVTKPLSVEQIEETGLQTRTGFHDTRRILNYYRLLPDNRILLGSRGAIRESPTESSRSKVRLLNTLKKKFPKLTDIDIEYAWGGWVCIPYDFTPHVSRAMSDDSVYYALGYSGSGVSAAVYSGKVLANQIGGLSEIGASVLHQSLKQYPVAALRRPAQRALTTAYEVLDKFW